MGLSLRGKTILVTGASGFVGSWLVQALLEAESKVVCLIRDADPASEFSRSHLSDRVVVVHGDLEEVGLSERIINHHEPDIIFHLGAQTLVGKALRSPVETLESNVRGTYLLLDAARQIACCEAIVIASSDKAYGTLVREKYEESDPLKGEHPYDVSKSCTDLISTMYHVTYGLPITIARCGNIYGGGDTNWSRIVPGTIKALQERMPPQIRSDGTLVRDYLHVRDVVRAYIKLAEAIKDPEVSGNSFNFSADNELTVLEVVQRIQKHMHCEEILPHILSEAHAEIPKQVLSSDKARRVLGWAPAIDFDTGLREAIQWYARTETTLT